MFRKRYKPASWLGIVCLALMLVVLGAVAKNSQFQSPSHSNHYLKQSVKMVAGQDDAGVLDAPPAPAPLPLAYVPPTKASRAVPLLPSQNPFTPLLL